MKFTIVIAAMNAESTLERAIKSVVQQTHKDYELIVIDGGSADGTVDIIRSFQAEIAYWESKPDNGVYHAWNKALRHATGDWVCFLGADDFLWSKDALAQMVKHLVNAYPYYRVVYGRVALVNSSGQIISYLGAPWERVKKRFMSLMSIPHPGVMYHRSFFGDHGMFDDTFQISGDYEMLLRELKDHDAHFVPSMIVSGMQLGGISNDPNRTIESLEEVRLAHKRHLKEKSGWRWWVAWGKVRVRVFVWRLIGERNARIILDRIRLMMGLPRYWTRL